MEALRVAQGASTYIVKSSNASGETAFGEVYGVLSVRNGDLTIQTGPSGDVRVYFARSDPRRSIPAWKVLDPGADLSDLKGTIVFFGASAATLSDIVATPLTPWMPGVDEAHAQIVEQLLSGQTLTRPDPGPERGVDGDGCDLRGAGGHDLGLGAQFAALVFAAVVAAIVAASWFAFRAPDCSSSRPTPRFPPPRSILPASPPSTQSSVIRSARFVPPSALRLARGCRAAGGNAWRPRARRPRAAADLAVLGPRGIHDHLGGAPRSELTRFLNEYLTPMTDAMLDRLGTVDKYMGDAIMAFWNAPLDEPTMPGMRSGRRWRCGRRSSR